MNILEIQPLLKEKDNFLKVRNDFADAIAGYVANKGNRESFQFLQTQKERELSNLVKFDGENQSSSNSPNTHFILAQEGDFNFSAKNVYDFLLEMNLTDKAKISIYQGDADLVPEESTDFLQYHRTFPSRTKIEEFTKNHSYSLPFIRLFESVGFNWESIQKYREISSLEKRLNSKSGQIARWMSEEEIDFYGGVYDSDKDRFDKIKAKKNLDNLNKIWGERLKTLIQVGIHPIKKRDYLGKDGSKFSLGYLDSSDEFDLTFYEKIRFAVTCDAERGNSILDDPMINRIKNEVKWLAKVQTANDDPCADWMHRGEMVEVRVYGGSNRWVPKSSVKRYK